MARARKRNLSPRDAKRLKTLRENKSAAQISADARRAGKMSGGHFTSESSRKANAIRWERWRQEEIRRQAENDEEDYYSR